MRRFTQSRWLLSVGCLAMIGTASVCAQGPNVRRPLTVAERDAWPGRTTASTSAPLKLARQVSNQTYGTPGLPLVEESLDPGPVIGHSEQPYSVRDYSRIYFESARPSVIKVHDIVTIVVDEKSEVIMNQKFNRQKTGKFTADLKEFVRFSDAGNLTSAAGGSPKIDGQLTSGLNTNGVVTDQEGIKYRIAAKVTDVKFNGTIHLEARKEIRNQDDVSEYTLTGEVRAKDIKPDNTASSENIANLQIVKRQKGRVYDSTKRAWGVKILDALSPF